MGETESVVFPGSIMLEGSANFHGIFGAVRGPVYVTQNTGGGLKGDKIHKGVRVRLTGCFIYQKFTGLLDYKGL